MPTDDQDLPYASQAERQRALDAARRLREQAATLLSPPVPPAASATDDHAGAALLPIPDPDAAPPAGSE